MTAAIITFDDPDCVRWYAADAGRRSTTSVDAAHHFDFEPAPDVPLWRQPAIGLASPLWKHAPKFGTCRAYVRDADSGLAIATLEFNPAGVVRLIVTPGEIRTVAS